MKVITVRSDKCYKKILNADIDKKDDIYRYDLMSEFAHKWACYNVPMKAKQNIRFQFILWSNNITLEEMMINEGLAENFATLIYGEEMLGPWVTTTDMETLNDYIKPIIKEALTVQGLEGITAYLYGDEIAEDQGYFPEGLPFCAGYACGYHMIKYYLQKTGKSIIEATLMPYEEIKKDLVDFWEL